MLSRIVLFFVLYNWLLGPRFVFLDVMWIAVAGCALIAPLLSAHRVVNSPSMNVFWLGAGFLTCYSLFISIFYETFDFGYAASWFKALIFSYSAASLILIYRRRFGCDALEKLISDIVLASVISGLISIAIFVTPALRELTNNFIVGTIANSWTGQKGLRAYDLSVGGGTAYGLYNVIVGIALYNYKNLYSQSARLLIFLLLGVVIFLSARSSFIVAVILAGYAIITNFSARNMLPLIRRLVGVAIFGLTVAVIFRVSGFASAILDEDFSSHFIDNVLPWAFELLFNFDSGDGLRSTTTDHMINEFFIPNTELGFLFGMGNSSPMSDSGFVRTVFSVGFIGFLIHLFIVAGFWRNIFLLSAFDIGKKIFSLVLIVILLFNFKELIFSNSRGLFGVIVVLYFSVIILRPINRLRTS